MKTLSGEEIGISTFREVLFDRRLISIHYVAKNGWRFLHLERKGFARGHVNEPVIRTIAYLPFRIQLPPRFLTGARPFGHRDGQNAVIKARPGARLFVRFSERK